MLFAPIRWGPGPTRACSISKYNLGTVLLSIILWYPSSLNCVLIYLPGSNNIADSNGYNKQLIIRLDNAIRLNKHHKTDESKDNKKWVTFTYTGNYIRTITKLFKHTKVQIAFKIGNTIDNLLKETRNINTFEQAGIYKLNCMDCQKVYIGHTITQNYVQGTYQKH
jgi:hypothetical protein